MPELPEPDPSSPSSPENPDAAPSLKDIDALLASASDLAQELAGELGPAESLARSVEDLAPLPAASASAVAELDAGLAELDKLVVSATTEVGDVESASGDTQILEALASPSTAPPAEQESPPAPPPPPPATFDDDDLTVSKTGEVLDPFGAPPPRGGASNRKTPPSPSKPKTPAPSKPESPPSHDGDLVAVTDSVAATPDTPSENAGNSAIEADAKPAVKAPPLAAPARAARALLRSAGRGIAALLELLDLPFRRVPVTIKVIAGWVAVATFLAATGVVLWTLLSR
ncbi:MAG: hypothetical protein BroJett003_23660 [Planctomycetota bacterium]|nr:MAG: hypothetical protein BroJett003_23660 [Planctomycetota bacterium]